MTLGIGKNPRNENPHLRDMARKFGCYLWLSPRCTGVHFAETTVLAHENSLSAGKGMGYKAHDWRGVFACYSCHTALDQQSEHDAGTKSSVFLQGLARMAVLYLEILRSPTTLPADKQAAAWAFDHVMAYVPEEISNLEAKC